MNRSLTSTSDDLAALVEKNEQSVVSIGARRGYPSSGIVWSSDGLIVTAQHGVEWDEGIEVAFADENKAKANLVGRDPTTDVAVLRVERSDLPTADWTNLDDAKVGNLVLGISRASRLRATINTAVIVPAQGICFAIPSNTVQFVAGRLIRDGEIRRSYMGIGGQDVPLPPRLARRHDLAAPNAVLVLSVQPKGPAENAGVRSGDLLVAYDGNDVTGIDDLHLLLAEHESGARVSLSVIRNGQKVMISLVPEVHSSLVG